jgi:flavin reductase (DIM6/NTAB) family NADH-FMN oxidoreductase RutF
MALSETIKDKIAFISEDLVEEFLETFKAEFESADKFEEIRLAIVESILDDMHGALVDIHYHPDDREYDDNQERRQGV